MRAVAAASSFLILILLAACQAAPTSITFTEDDAAAVRSMLLETYAPAMLEGDVETAVSIWAYDAIRVPPTGGKLVGLEAIRAAYEGMPYRVTALDWTNLDVRGSGDLAIMLGDYAFAGEIDAGSFSETGTTFVAFRRDGGEWKIIANMWRPDPAVAEALEEVAE